MNATEKTEVIMTEEGWVVRRQISENPLEIGELVVNQLCSTVTRTLKSVFEVPGWGVANLCITRDNAYYTIPINTLPLKANFMVQDDVLFPRFSASNEPVLPMVWNPPADMRLLMLVMMTQENSKPSIGCQFLFAMDGESRLFKMPLGNLHDDARLCAGGMRLTHATTQAALWAVMEQLEKGQWQGDLDRQPEQTRKLFRYKAEKSVFVQQPSIGSWQESCVKISPNVSKFILL
jgi:hypothetical protein